MYICTYEVYVRGYPDKLHVQVIFEVKEDKVDKFLELIPGLFFGAQVDSTCFRLFFQFLKCQQRSDR